MMSLVPPRIAPSPVNSSPFFRKADHPLKHHCYRGSGALQKAYESTANPTDPEKEKKNGRELSLSIRSIEIYKTHFS